MQHAPAAPRVTAVVLAYRDQPFLAECLQRLLDSEGVEVDVVLVDNGCTSPPLAPLVADERVRLVSPGGNTGFTGGCNLGASAAKGDVLCFINSDALVEPTALRALAEAVEPVDVGLACASVRLEQDPERLNSAGNPVHVLGLSWAGSFGEPAADHEQPRDVASASGAALAVRRDTWADLGGFTDEFFAYCEDTDLSIRAWQRGLRVVYEPSAVVLHHYEANRNELKFYLLERNRLAMLATTYERRTLLLLLPPLLAFEFAMVIAAAAGGWLGSKLRGYRWLWEHRHWIAKRRHAVQQARSVDDAALAHLLTAHFDATVIALPRIVAPLNVAMKAYWSRVVPRLRRAGS